MTNQERQLLILTYFRDEWLKKNSDKEAHKLFREATRKMRASQQLFKLN